MRVGQKHNTWMLYALLGGFYVFGASWDGATGQGGAWCVRLALLGLCFTLHSDLRDKDHVSQGLFFPCLGVLFVLWGVLGMAHPGLALQLCSRMLFCLAFYMLLQIAAEHIYIGLARFFLGCACLYSCWVLLEWLLGQKDRFSAGFFNPNHLSAFLVPCALMLLVYGLRGVKCFGLNSKCLILFSFLCAGGVLATQSRMGLIVLVLCGLMIVLSLGPRASRKPVMLGLGLIFLVGAYVLLPRFMGKNDPNAYSRIAIWQSSLEIAAQHPLGVGLGGGADALRMHGVAHGDVVRYAHVAKHGHSEFLNLILECGWPGLVLLFLGLAYVAVMHFQITRADKAKHAPELSLLIESPWVAVAITLSFLLPACTSNTWHVPPIAYLMVFWFSFLHRAYIQTLGNRSSLLSPQLWLYSIRILVMIAFAFVTTQALGHYALHYSGQAQKQGDLAKAQEYAHYAAGLSPWNIGPQLMLVALDYNASGSVDAALEGLAVLAEQFPKSPEPLKRAIFVLKHTNTIQEKRKSRMMLEFRQELASREPKNVLLWLQAGESAESAGDFVLAEKFFRKALETEPYCARALSHVAGYEKKAGNIEDVYKYVNLAWQSDNLAKNYRGYALDVLSLDEQAHQRLVSLK